MKVVINTDFGGFGLSNKAICRYLELSGIEYQTKVEKYNTYFYHKGFVGNDSYIIDEYKFERNDIFLVKTVEELAEEANSAYSSLKVVEIPDDIKYTIEDYDGREHIAEAHRTWY